MSSNVSKNNSKASNKGGKDSREDQVDVGPSYISFELKPLSEKDVGVVYIVTNDYHADPTKALGDHGKDFKHMENLFCNLVDNYHVTIAQSATYKKFVATCKYLADRKKYPVLAKESSYIFQVMLAMDTFPWKRMQITVKNVM